MSFDEKKILDEEQLDQIIGGYTIDYNEAALQATITLETGDVSKFMSGEISIDTIVADAEAKIGKSLTQSDISKLSKAVSNNLSGVLRGTKTSFLVTLTGAPDGSNQVVSVA